MYLISIPYIAAVAHNSVALIMSGQTFFWSLVIRRFGHRSFLTRLALAPRASLSLKRLSLSLCSYTVSASCLLSIKNQGRVPASSHVRTVAFVPSVSGAASYNIDTPSALTRGDKKTIFATSDDDVFWFK